MRLPALASAFLLSFAPLASPAFAQGLTAGAVRGSVRSADGQDLDGAAVRVVNTATGFAAHVDVAHGSFLDGLDRPARITSRWVGR